MISEKKGFEVVFKVDSEDDPVRSKVRKYKNLPIEKFSSWIEAGEGNYSFTKDSGKYRPSCNTLQGIRLLKKCDSCGDVKKIISHCDENLNFKVLGYSSFSRAFSFLTIK